MWPSHLRCVYVHEVVNIIVERTIVSKEMVWYLLHKYGIRLARVVDKSGGISLLLSINIDSLIVLHNIVIPRCFPLFLNCSVNNFSDIFNDEGPFFDGFISTETPTSPILCLQADSKGTNTNIEMIENIMAITRIIYLEWECLRIYSLCKELIPTTRSSLTSRRTFPQLSSVYIFIDMHIIC